MNAPRLAANTIDPLLIHRQILARSTEAIAVIDLQGVYIQQNPAHEQLLGYTDADLAGQTPAVHLGDAAFHRIAQALQRDGVFEGEAQSKTKDARALTIHLSAYTLYDEQGRPSCYVGFKRDITTHKAAQEALKASDEQWRTLVHTIPGYVLKVDPQGKILFINQTISGGDFTTQDVMSKTMFDFVPPGSHDVLRNALEQVFHRGMTAYYEVPALIDNAGHTRWFSSRMAPIRLDGRVIAAAVFSTDITDYLKAQEALKESEEQWRTLVQTIPDFVVKLDRDGRVCYINRTLPDGYTEQEMLSFTVFDIAPAEFHPQMHEAMRMVFEQGETITYEGPANVGHNLLPRWFAVRMSPYRKDGRVIAATLIATDMTAAKETEQKLRASEEKYRRLIDNLPSTFMYIHNTDGVFTYLSPTIRDVLGYTEAEFLTSYTAYLTDNPVNQDVVRHTELSLQGLQQPPYEVEVWHKNGSRRWMEVREIPLRDDTGAVIGVEGVSTDITERKRIIEALRESEARYRLLFESTADAIMIAGGGKIISCNLATVQMFGYGSKQELVGLHPSEFSPPAQPDGRSSRDAANERIREAFANGSAQFEWIHRRKNGEDFPTHIMLSAITLGDQQIIQANIRDLTKQRELEKQLNQAQKMESIGTLAGGIAHDFNNIVGTVLGYASLLKHKVALQPELLRIAEGIEKAGLKATQLTSHLLSFSRKREPLAIPTDAAALLREDLTLLERTLPRNISIRKPILAEPAWVLMDGGLFSQSILNLCLNAKDAMPDGGALAIDAAVVAPDEKIRSQLVGLGPERYFRIRIADTGCGMSPDVQKRAFDPFFTTKPQGKGTGLGLSMVYGFVRAGNGVIHLDSRVGSGTTVTLYLPVLSEFVPAAPAAVSPETLQRGSGAVLVVDDEQEILDMASSLLKELGYRPLTVNSGKQAVEWLERPDAHAVRAVILDLLMPEQDGVATLGLIRARHPQLPVIISSAYDSPEIRNSLRAHSIQGNLAKPYRIQALSQALAKALAGATS